MRSNRIRGIFIGNFSFIVCDYERSDFFGTKKSGVSLAPSSVMFAVPLLTYVWDGIASGVFLIKQTGLSRLFLFKIFREHERKFFAFGGFFIGFSVENNCGKKLYPATMTALIFCYKKRHALTKSDLRLPQNLHRKILHHLLMKNLMKNCFLKYLH